METLATYLVLSGHLTPGESLLLQKIADVHDLAIRQARKDLRKSGFSDSSTVIKGLETKGLIDVSSTVISTNWKGISTFTAAIEGSLTTMVHELWSLKNIAELEAGKPLVARRGTNGSTTLRIQDLLEQFKGNKPNLSERKLLQALNAPLESIDIINWLEELGALKILKKKRSRSLSLTAEGAALRYLFLNNTRNRAHYEYLEKRFLSPQETSWDDFIEVLSDPDKKAVLSSSLQFTMRLFKELGVIIESEDEPVLFELPIEEESPLNDPAELERWISGFIPVYVENLWRVLRELPADTATIQQETGLGASSVSGIRTMLAKFKLARKDSKKNSWSPSKLGRKLAKLPEDEFSDAFKPVIESFPFFDEVLKFVHPHAKIGFLDLAGYFRANQIANFNPAKSLAVLRIMEQTGLGLEAVPGEAGMYQPITNAN